MVDINKNGLISLEIKEGKSRWQIFLCLRSDTMKEVEWSIGPIYDSLSEASKAANVIRLSMESSIKQILFDDRRRIVEGVESLLKK